MLLHCRLASDTAQFDKSVEPNCSLLTLSDPYNLYNRKWCLYMPWGFQENEASTLQDGRHMKVVRLSALHTGRRFHCFTHFC